MDSRRFEVNSWYLIHRLVNLVYHGPGTLDRGDKSPWATTYPKKKMAPAQTESIFAWLSDVILEDLNEDGFEPSREPEIQRERIIILIIYTIFGMHFRLPLDLRSTVNQLR